MIEVAVIVAFLLGFAKQWSYGLVLLMHAGSTLASYKKYLQPFESPNLLFFAAIPMLAACFVLYYLRDVDVFWTIKKREQSIFRKSGFIPAPKAFGPSLQ